MYGPNGFDFGMSDPKTGLGYGLLGDTQTLRAIAAQAGCDNCPPEQPCPSCQDAQPDSGSDQGQIIKTQFPIPAPGLIPPPIGLWPQQPSKPVIIGDPNAWWNWTPGEVEDWIQGIFEARPSKEVTAKCEAQFENDKARCEGIKQRAQQAAGPQAGSREWAECNKTAMTRYGECRTKNGQTTTQPYPDWYGSN